MTEIKNNNDAGDDVYELGDIATLGHNDYQQIRIAQRSRVRDVVRRKTEGIPLDSPEEAREERTYDKKYEDKNLPKLLGQLVLDGKLTDFEKEYIEKLFKISDETAKTEERYKALMDQYLKKEKIWYMWLEKIKGISSVIGSNLLKNLRYCEIIIKDKETGKIIGRESGNSDEFKEAMEKYKENHDEYVRSGYNQVSSIWRHWGLDPDGAKGRQAGVKIYYNPKLKTFAWKISDSFVKQNTPVYREIYDSEKIRQGTKRYDRDISDKTRIVGDLLDEDVGEMKEGTKIYSDKKRENYKKLVENAEKNGKETVRIRLSDGHIDAKARRKMVKIFLQHYYLIGRKLKGLRVTDPYPQDKLGHTHIIKPPFDPFDSSSWEKPDPKVEDKKEGKKSTSKTKTKK